MPWDIVNRMENFFVYSLCCVESPNHSLNLIVFNSRLMLFCPRKTKAEAVISTRERLSIKIEG